MAGRRFVLVVCVFNCVAYADRVTFKNVSVWESPFKQIASDVSANSLKTILGDTFRLDVYVKGRIPILHNDSVSDIHNVENLDFFDNGIVKIETGAFKNSSLHTLTISRSNLTSVDGVFDNLSVENLAVSYSQIAKISPMKNLTKLGSLSFNQNKINTIQDGAFDQLSTLEMLDLSDNLISSLPARVFKNLTSLQMLFLRSNKLDAIPEDAVAHLPVHNLDLGDNLITSIPMSFLNGLPRLTRIVLSKNRLTSIPEGIFNNRNLIEVELADNRIAHIAPGAFDNMPQLTNINLSGNKLTKYDKRWFHNTPNIYRLHLSYNLFEEIPDGAFQNIYNHKAQWVTLDNNKIGNISTGTFRGFRQILYLGLGFNQIDSWDETFLLDAQVVHYLELTGNRIKCFEGDFDKIFKANFTYVYQNPLDDGCLKNIEEWKIKNPGKAV